MVSGLNIDNNDARTLTNVVVTRDFDGRKHSVIFLDRDWFEKGSMFITENGHEIEILKKVKRISESETCYELKNDSLWKIYQLTGYSLQYIGNVNHLYTNLQMLQEQPATTYSLTVFDNTRSSNLVCTVEDLPDTQHKEPNPAYYSEAKPEPLYSEEDLVPSQFFGLNDYLKCEI